MPYPITSYASDLDAMRELDKVQKSYNKARTEMLGTQTRILEDQRRREQEDDILKEVERRLARDEAIAAMGPGTVSPGYGWVVDVEGATGKPLPKGRQTLMIGEREFDPAQLPGEITAMTQALSQMGIPAGMGSAESSELERLRGRAPGLAPQAPIADVGSIERAMRELEPLMKATYGEQRRIGAIGGAERGRDLLRARVTAEKGEAAGMPEARKRGVLAEATLTETKAKTLGEPQTFDQLSTLANEDIAFMAMAGKELDRLSDPMVKGSMSKEAWGQQWAQWQEMLGERLQWYRENTERRRAMVEPKGAGKDLVRMIESAWKDSPDKRLTFMGQTFSPEESEKIVKELKDAGAEATTTDLNQILRRHHTAAIGRADTLDGGRVVTLPSGEKVVVQPEAVEVVDTKLKRLGGVSLRRLSAEDKDALYVREQQRRDQAATAQKEKELGKIEARTAGPFRRGLAKVKPWLSLGGSFQPEYTWDEWARIWQGIGGDVLRAIQGGTETRSGQ